MFADQNLVRRVCEARCGGIDGADELMSLAESAGRALNIAEIWPLVTRWTEVHKVAALSTNKPEVELFGQDSCSADLAAPSTKSNALLDAINKLSDDPSAFDAFVEVLAREWHFPEDKSSSAAGGLRSGASPTTATNPQETLLESATNRLRAQFTVSDGSVVQAAELWRCCASAIPGFDDVYLADVTSDSLNDMSALGSIARVASQMHQHSQGRSQGRTQTNASKSNSGPGFSSVSTSPNKMANNYWTEPTQRPPRMPLRDEIMRGIAALASMATSGATTAAQATSSESARARAEAIGAATRMREACTVIEDATAMPPGVLDGLIAVARADTHALPAAIMRVTGQLHRDERIDANVIAGLVSLAEAGVTGVEDLTMGSSALRSLDPDIIEGLVVVSSGEQADVIGSESLCRLLRLLGLNVAPTVALLSVLKAGVDNAPLLAEMLALDVKPGILRSLLAIANAGSDDMSGGGDLAVSHQTAAATAQAGAANALAANTRALLSLLEVAPEHAPAAARVILLAHGHLSALRGAARDLPNLSEESLDFLIAIVTVTRPATPRRPIPLARGSRSSTGFDCGDMGSISRVLSMRSLSIRDAEIWEVLIGAARFVPSALLKLGKWIESERKALSHTECRARARLLVEWCQDVAPITQMDEILMGFHLPTDDRASFLRELTNTLNERINVRHKQHEETSMTGDAADVASGPVRMTPDLVANIFRIAAGVIDGRFDFVNTNESSSSLVFQRGRQVFSGAFARDMMNDNEPSASRGDRPIHEQDEPALAVECYVLAAIVVGQVRVFETFPVGTRVTLHSLLDRSDLNDQLAIVTKAATSKDPNRVSVRLHGKTGRVASIRKTNLRTASPDEGSSASKADSPGLPCLGSSTVVQQLLSQLWRVHVECDEASVMRFLVMLAHGDASAWTNLPNDQAIGQDEAPLLSALSALAFGEPQTALAQLPSLVDAIHVSSGGGADAQKQSAVRALVSIGLDNASLEANVLAIEDIAPTLNLVPSLARAFVIGNCRASVADMAEVIAPFCVELKIAPRIAAGVMVAVGGTLRGDSALASDAFLSLSNRIGHRLVETHDPDDAVGGDRAIWGTLGAIAAGDPARVDRGMNELLLRLGILQPDELDTSAARQRRALISDVILTCQGDTIAMERLIRTQLRVGTRMRSPASSEIAKHRVCVSNRASASTSAPASDQAKHRTEAQWLAARLDARANNDAAVCTAVAQLYSGAFETHRLLPISVNKLATTLTRRASTRHNVHAPPPGALQVFFGGLMGDVRLLHSGLSSIAEHFESKLERSESSDEGAIAQTKIMAAARWRRAESLVALLQQVRNTRHLEALFEDENLVCGADSPNRKLLATVAQATGVRAEDDAIGVSEDAALRLFMLLLGSNSSSLDSAILRKDEADTVKVGFGNMLKGFGVKPDAGKELLKVAASYSEPLAKNEEFPALTKLVLDKAASNNLITPPPNENAVKIVSTILRMQSGSVDEDDLAYLSQNLSEFKDSINETSTFLRVALNSTQRDPNGKQPNGQYELCRIFQALPALGDVLHGRRLSKSELLLLQVIEGASFFC